MPDSYPVSPRETIGKKVKRLRLEGVMPANIYGRGIESRAVQMPSRSALAMLREHGLNTLVEIDVEGEDAPRSVVVRGTQRHPVTRELQHIDFYQVDLNRVIQASVPVHLTGEAPAVATHHGVVLQGMDTVLVEALPASMPTSLDVSIDSLVELEATLTVGDIQLPEGVRLLIDAGSMLVRVAPPRVEEETQEAILEGEEVGVEGEEAAADSAAGDDSESE